MVRCRYALVATALAFLLAPAGPSLGAEAARARILVVFHADPQPYDIQVGSGVEGPREAGNGKRLFESARAGAVYRRADVLEVAFRKTMGDFDRNRAVINALNRMFDEPSNLFEVATSTDTFHYLDGLSFMKLTDAAAADGFQFVLAINETFVGLRNLTLEDTHDGLLAPAQAASIVLHDVSKRKVLYRGHVNSRGTSRAPYEVAVEDRSFFAVQWDTLCASLANAIVGELKRADQLHVMAESVGRGAENPAVAATLRRYAKRINWNLVAESGWRQRAQRSAYSRVLEPRSDEMKKQVALHFDVDLLIPEFGQDVDSIEEYVPIFNKILAEQAQPLPPLAPFDDISVRGFKAFYTDSASGGRNVVLFRIIGDSAIQIVTAVFVRDFSTLFPTVRAKLESMVAKSAVRVD